MQLPRPVARVVTKPDLDKTDMVSRIESSTVMRRGYTSQADSTERAPTPPLEHRDQGSEPDMIEEEVYFKLTVKQGLFV